VSSADPIDGDPRDDEVVDGEVIDDLTVDADLDELEADLAGLGQSAAPGGAGQSAAPGGAGQSAAPGGAGQSAEDAVVEAVEFAQRVETERDELRDLVQRVKADFDNYKRRVEVQRAEQRAVAAMDLVNELLPVLDACDAAIVAGHDDVAPVQSQLFATLAKRGLVKVSDVDVDFDPNVHEAVLHEEGDGDPVVVEVLRAGYLWNDHVVRAAMVKVKG